MFEKDPPKDLDVLIVDEAQHDVTASMGHIHAAVQPKHILGLSSTPYRVDRVKLCFDSVLKDAGIPTLIADGYLSQFEHYTIPTWSPEAVALQYISDVERWGKSIMYFHRLAQCAEAKEKLERAGISCDVVTGSSDVEQQLENFANGKLQVMLNCMKLTEGLDVVDLKTVFCRPACKPVTIQMAGRVLRKHPDLPVKQIVQTAGTPYPFPRLALPSLQHVLIDGTWRTLEVNKDIDTINHRCIHALAHIEVAMPEFIKKAQKTTPRWGGRRRGQRPQ
jgi:superfamily II DNA or RNA helicase